MHMATLWLYLQRGSHTCSYTMAIPWLYHGHTMAIPWPYHGCTMAIPWLYHGHTMAIPWLYHGHTMAIPWLYHGYTMAVPWLYHGDTCSEASSSLSSPSCLANCSWHLASASVRAWLG